MLSFERQKAAIFWSSLVLVELSFGAGPWSRKTASKLPFLLFCRLHIFFCLFVFVRLSSEFHFSNGSLQISSTLTRSFGKLEARSIPAKSCSAEIKIKMEIWFRFNVGLSKPRRSSKRGAATFSRWTKFRRTDFFAYCGSAKLVLPRTAQPGSSCFNKNQSVAPSLGTC